MSGCRQGGEEMSPPGHTHGPMPKGGHKSNGSRSRQERSNLSDKTERAWNIKEKSFLGQKVNH